MRYLTNRNFALLSVAFATAITVACAEAGATDPASTEAADSASASPAIDRSNTADFQPETTHTPSPRPTSAATPPPPPDRPRDVFADVWKKRIERAMGDESCTESPHQLNPNFYTGPLIDTHYHVPHLPDSQPLQGELSSPYLDVANLERFNHEFPLLGVNMSAAEIACSLRNEGTDGAFAFFPVFPQIADQSIEVVRLSMNQYGDIFFPFINAGGAGTPTVENEELKVRLDFYPGLFEGYGEIPLYSAGGPDDEALPPDSAVFDGIFDTASSEGLAVYFHPGVDQIDSFSQVLSAYPDVSFIVHGEQIENEITQLMALHDNIYFTVDTLYGDQYLLHQGENAESFVEKVSDYGPLLEKDLGTWKEAIETYPDQFFWGTDRGGIAVWTFDIDVGRAISDYARAFIAELDPAVQDRFAYENALRAMNRDVDEWLAAR